MCNASVACTFARKLHHALFLAEFSGILTYCSCAVLQGIDSPLLATDSHVKLVFNGVYAEEIVDKVRHTRCTLRPHWLGYKANHVPRVAWAGMA